MNPADRDRLLADVEAFCQGAARARGNRATSSIASTTTSCRWPRSTTCSACRSPSSTAAAAPMRSTYAGAGPHRPGGDRRPHVLLRAHQHRPIPDHDLGQRRAETALPARLVQGRQDPRVRPDRARGRQQPARDAITYERQGDDYVLNGVKYLISNAGIATTVVMFAYPEGGGRISAFIIDMDQPGFAREDLSPRWACRRRTPACSS